MDNNPQILPREILQTLPDSTVRPLKYIFGRLTSGYLMVRLALFPAAKGFTHLSCNFIDRSPLPIAKVHFVQLLIGNGLFIKALGDVSRRLTRPQHAAADDTIYVIGGEILCNRLCQIGRASCRDRGESWVGAGGGHRR